MQMLQDLIDYTKKKKEYQIGKLETHYSKSLSTIDSYIVGEKDDSIVGMRMSNLSTWYQWKFVHSFLFEGILNHEYLVYSTYYGFESNNWDFFLGKQFPSYDEAIQFHKAINHLAQMLLLGWDKLAVQYGNMLITMLYGKQYKGWHPAYKHPWFMLEIFCKWQKIKLNYSQLHYPEDMGIYREMLENWDTKDQRWFSRMINKMVEFHLNESDENEYEDRTPDFPSSDYFIYAVEILLWLNIRERKGLPEYVPDNELMKLPLNNWHTQNMPIPEIKLIEQAKTKLSGDYLWIKFEI